ncbi:MAG: GNAT family N-acetyltransferase [Betaproteobacteria bacterium]
MPFAPSAHAPDDVRRWVARKLIPTDRVTVAEVEGRVIAVLATSHDGAVSWIDQLCVLPGYVRRGIGTRLLASAHSDLPLPIRLFTFQPNVRARRFYERLGYEAIEFTDGSANEERCPDVLYEYRSITAT